MKCLTQIKSYLFNTVDWSVLTFADLHFTKNEQRWILNICICRTVQGICLQSCYDFTLSRLLSKLPVLVFALLEFSMLHVLLFQLLVWRSLDICWTPFPLSLLVTVGDRTIWATRCYNSHSSVFISWATLTFWCWQHQCSQRSSAPGPTPHHLHGSCTW